MGYSFKKQKGATITDAFQRILNDSKRKPNKIWVDKGSEFYSRSMKSWLQDNDVKVYSTHNEGKSVLAERFIRTLKIKIYKYMTSISKKLYFDKLDDTVNKYNNTYHRTIKMNLTEVKDNTYIDFGKEYQNNKVRISKYKNIFAKGYTPNWSEDNFVIKKVENTDPWTYVINNLNDEEIVRTFYEKLQKNKSKRISNRKSN